MSDPAGFAAAMACSLGHDPTLEDLLSGIRRAGWTVVVHNDYRQAGRADVMTFWLFTDGGATYVGAEAPSDRAALLSIASRIAGL